MKEWPSSTARRMREEAAHGEEEKARETAGSKEGTEEIGARSKVGPQVSSSFEEGSSHIEADRGRSFAGDARGGWCATHAPGRPGGSVTRLPHRGSNTHLILKENR